MSAGESSSRYCVQRVKREYLLCPEGENQVYIMSEG